MKKSRSASKTPLWGILLQQMFQQAVQHLCLMSPLKDNVLQHLDTSF